MAQHKVKIAARLRPAILGELDDNGVLINTDDDAKSYICVSNPRDLSQQFKYPLVSYHYRTVLVLMMH